MLADYDEGYQKDDSIQSEKYRQTAGKYDAFLKETQEELGVYDIFLITPEGDIVSTATHEADFATNLISGPYKNSNLARGFKQVKDELLFVDFEHYEPSNEPCGFMLKRFATNSSQRGRWAKGESVGVIAIQVPMAKINQIMLRRNGMGNTGETYLVGPDKLMRSDSFLDPVGHSMVASFKNNTTVDTEAVQQALAGKENQKVILDYNGTLCYLPGMR